MPSLYSLYVENADFIDEIDHLNSEGHFYFLGISKGDANQEWPSLVSVQRYDYAYTSISPGILLVPDTSLVFVGAGTRLLCYDLKKQARLWEEEAYLGFWGWSQAAEYVLLSAECEFAVWDQYGKKLWSTFVEPPWSFEVKGEIVELDVMGSLKNLRLADRMPAD
ncbi:MAG: hypothetical protein AAGD04_12145 [Pseudomonadota bacterium]